MEILNTSQTEERILQTFRELNRFAISTYGPTGGIKIIQPNSKCAFKSIFTSSSSRIIQQSNFGLNFPLSQLLVQIMSTQIEKYREHGLFVMIFTTELVLQAKLKQHEHQIPVHMILQGYTVALEWVKEDLDSRACAINLGDMQAMLGIVRNVIGAKASISHMMNDDDDDDDGQQNQLYMDIIELFLSISSIMLANQEPQDPLVRFIPLVHPTSCGIYHMYQDSFVMPQDNRSRDDTGRHFEKAMVVVVYDVSLLPAAEEKQLDSKILRVASDGHHHHRSCTLEHEFERTRMLFQDLIQVYQKLGVQVVISQKIIPRMLENMLSVHDIYVIDKVSRVHIDAVRKITGARVISTCHSPVTREVLGLVQSIGQMKLEGQDYLVFHPASPELLETWRQVILPKVIRERQVPVISVILTGLDSTAVEELEHVIQNALYVLRCLLFNNRAVPGGGCIEIQLAKCLRARVGTLKSASSNECPLVARRHMRQMKAVLNTVATCFETIVTSLDHHREDDDASVTLSREKMLCQLHSANTSGVGPSGWDAPKHRPESSSVLNLLELYESKRHAIQLSMDTACTVLRTAGILAST